MPGQHLDTSQRRDGGGGARTTADAGQLAHSSSYNAPQRPAATASHDDRQKETILVLVLRNLANASYADPGFAGIDYPQLGRTAVLQAIQEF